ncbi:MAG: cytochrome C oxidase subunit IV [Chloroflexi bacterium]|nr:cytochrome C oxidase subunit IV [Chloroflexota bacterium]
MSAQAPTHTNEHSHPGPNEYIKIAAVLGAITVVEVAIYYIPALRPVIMPLLIVLSATKFAMVAGFYMHLKFDHRIFTSMFVVGLVAAAFMIVAFIVLFHFLRAPLA